MDSGFVLLKGVLKTDSLEKCIQGQTCDYEKVKQFIDGVMMPTIGTQLDWEPVYTKYRLSDNNNSVDAGGFHRDIIHVRGKVTPVYTCLTYLDRTVMELFPGSFKELRQDYGKSLLSYGNRVQVTVERGDILVFDSHTLHRGIFTEQLEHRRLLQVFDVFPSEELYDKKLLHVTGDETYGWFTLSISKNVFFVPILSFFAYLNSSTGYGNPASILDGEFTSFCPEGLCARVSVIPGTWQPLNKYILNRPVTDLPDELKTKFTFEVYNKQYSSYFFILVTFLILVLL
jgi:hypothetical protein